MILNRQIPVILVSWGGVQRFVALRGGGATIATLLSGQIRLFIASSGIFGGLWVNYNV
jgi:hypothetical protein